jgi:hypothetical protein
MKQLTVILAIMLLLLSCGGRRQLSPEELSHKLDSVKNVEINEKLRLQGIDLELSDNPLKQFYDSLNLQTLPISYTEDYVKFLPAFKPIPQEIIPFFELLDCNEPKAVSLPESLGAKLILIATDEQPHLYSLWLYSLDDDFRPVDKLCLYAIEDKSDEINPDEFIQYFSITSDYEIRLLDYSRILHKANFEEVYYIDSSRKFMMRESSLE